MSDLRREAVRLWVLRAASDWQAAEQLAERDDFPPDVVCFLLQQHVEKLIKGLLTLQGVEAPRIHDLRRLIGLCQGTAPDLSRLIDEADRLTPHAVDSRYPDRWRPIAREEVQQLFEIAHLFRDLLLPILEA
jgi:HEPN domain-containing protein